MNCNVLLQQSNCITFKIANFHKRFWIFIIDVLIEYFITGNLPIIRIIIFSDANMYLIDSGGSDELSSHDIFHVKPQSIASCLVTTRVLECQVGFHESSTA